MNTKKSIVFTTPYCYLALPHYQTILPILRNKQFKTTFLGLKVNDNSLIKLEDLFDEVCLIDDKKTKNLNQPKKNIIFENIKRVKKIKKLIYSKLDEFQTLAVISTSDLSLVDRIINRWCIRKNIPFIILQPSFIEGLLENYKSPSLNHKIKYIIFNKLLRAPLYSRQNLYGNETKSSYLLLWSKYFILNEKRKNTYFIGNPAFDSLFKSFSPERILKQKIVFCTENIDDIYGKEIYRQIIDAYIDAIQSKLEITFFVKVHPREPIEKYTEIFHEKEFQNVKVVKDRNLFDLYKECDIQISVNSYSSIEAAAYGLPVITITPDEIFEKITDFFQGEINIRTTDGKTFNSAIKKIYTDDFWEIFVTKREKYFKRLMFSTDGQSSKRAVDMIITIINKHKKLFIKI